MVTFRVVVRRTDTRRKPHQMVDAIECAVHRAPLAHLIMGHTGHPKAETEAWKVDDIVEVSGHLHRRFFRTAGAVASRVEVEVESGKVLRKGDEA